VPVVLNRHRSLSPKKTRFVAELIAERVECDGYRQKLSVPAKNAKMLDDVYEAAKAAYCLKPDV